MVLYLMPNLLSQQMYLEKQTGNKDVHKLLQLIESHSELFSLAFKNLVPISMEITETKKKHTKQGN